MAPGDHILHLDLSGPGAARAARRAVAELTPDLRALERSDLMLLVSELIGLAAASSAIEFDAWRDGDVLRFGVSGSAIREAVDPVTAALFDQLAARWQVCDGAAQFVIDKPSVFVADDDEEALLQRLRAGDDNAKAELARRYESFARALASKYVRSSIGREDVEQAAAIGLLKALERFDPDRGVKLGTYAAKTIEGELKRYLRDRGWSLRVPRRLQELGLEARSIAEDVAQTVGREPTLAEIADRIDAAPEEVGHAMLARQSLDAASLDAPSREEGHMSLLDGIPAHDQRLATAPEWADLSSVMDELPAREQRILFLRFFEDLSQSEIAERVGISQMHVSRLLSRAVEDLRLWIGITSEQTE